MLKNISLKKISFLTFAFILFFTLLFAFLLIYEEYKTFESRVNTQHKEHGSETTLVLDKNELIYDQNLKSLKSRAIKIILSISTLTFILFGIVLIALKIANKLIDQDIKQLLTFFADPNKNKINFDDLIFKEFKDISHNVNNMVGKIENQTSSLIELNATLEQKVEQKTHDLEEKNRLLTKEKVFSSNLLESQKSFIKYAVHETNTPLSIIMANVDLYNVKHESNRFISNIEVALKNVINIYDDLSYLIKKNQLCYLKQEINLTAFVKSRVEFFSEVANKNNHKIIFNSQKDESVIEFNETQLQRIVDNNITNAIKYTLQNNDIFIQINRDKEYTYFNISSHSQKIEDTRKVFVEYYREESDATGFGIGLNLVKNICDEEGILIDISSNEQTTLFSYRFLNKEYNL
ncbi:MAG: sensor histidine kinase [Helicobacteraceae bacterium]|nr:sensor histidine kinase [Helicobacteraceae bacterium]